MEPFLEFLHRLLFGPNKIYYISYRIKMFVLYYVPLTLRVGRQYILFISVARQ